MFYRQSSRRPLLVCWVLIGSAAALHDHAQGEETTPAGAALVQTLAQARMDGGDSARARRAWEELVSRDPGVLPQILAGMKDANPVGTNWLRTAFDAIVRREQRSGNPPIPVGDLRAIVLDGQYVGHARRLALSLLETEQPGATMRLLPALLKDPEFRLEAVDMLIAEADAALEADEKARAEQLYRTALAAATDYEQIKTLGARLVGLGQELDMRVQLGVPVGWHVVGPFPGHQMTGLERVYPPERKIDLGAEYQGASGPIRWQPAAPGPDGQVDLNQILGDSSDAVAYACCQIDMPQATEAELRAGADDNLVVWLNGERVFAFEHYYQHLRADRFRVPVRLEAGKNTLLVKVCQGPTPPGQVRPNYWSFLLRIVDLEGKPLKMPDGSLPRQSR